MATNPYAVPAPPVVANPRMMIDPSTPVLPTGIIQNQMTPDAQAKTSNVVSTVAPTPQPDATLTTQPATTSEPVSTPQPATPAVTPPSGIISGAVAPFAGPAAGTNYQVDPSTMTVQGRLKTLLDPNDPLMQQAQAQGQMDAAGRGMLNSSLAQTGAYDSMLKTAVPIATSDAASYNTAAAQNAANTTSQVNVKTQTDTQNIINDRTMTSQEKINALDNQTKTILTNASISSNEKISALQAQTSLQAAQIQADTSAANTAASIASAQAISQAQIQSTQVIAQYSALNQASSSATSLTTNYLAQVSSAMSSASDATALASQLAVLKTTYTDSMNVIGSLAGNANISQYLS